ncbi:toll/interleukin-1 receptor domain-containing protein [Sphingomonas sp. AR_OL41]|jgi:hypothetical protein|uniref:toll/interleukin-1 receptor domain-containing protein n=1 Tax=Sphingomonas sp. AR_OL41 TaxID=3042729 RepID=UPI002480160B|nr:toll/interleukin-1 receptor domain-containing protein [Sphingomonas sp. AR_OL41]MDH7973367.1 toll/interleukin-1 receptor domain-containing protein [Sphingomonas sp. AR_OL41]
MQQRVFISYCEKDQAMAFDLCHRIERRGVKCWIAPRDIAVGEDFSGRVIEAIEMAAVFVIVLSRHTNNSQYVKAEAETAFTAKRPIFPIRLENVEAERGLRLFLSIRHRTDAFGPGRNQAIDKFVDAVVRRATGSKIPPRPGNALVRSDIAQLIGPGAADFIAQWQGMDRRGARTAWSWEAFLGGAAWPFYRGLIPMGVALSLALALAVMIGGLATGSTDGALTGFALGWVAVSIFAGITGTAVLRRHVYRPAAARDSATGIARVGGFAGGIAVVGCAFLLAAQVAPVPTPAPIAAPIVANESAAPAAMAAGSSERRGGSPDPILAERQRQAAMVQGYIVGRLEQAAAAQNASAAAPPADVTDNDSMTTVTENRM